MLTIRHKRGTTLTHTGLVSDDAGTPINLTGYTVTAEVRTASGVLVVAATVTKDADQATNPGVFTLEVAADDTADWSPSAHLFFDVRVEAAGGRVDATETVAITVVAWVTQPEAP